MSIAFCSSCGAGVEKQIPEGDDRWRQVCIECGAIHYQNPKLVVGCIPEFDDQILFCRRNIEPCKGKWTLPAGFLETGESVKQGAIRETYEESLADVEILAPYRMFDLVFTNQIYLIFRARILIPEFGPTHESSEVRLLPESRIPWDDIAFPVIRETLVHYFDDRAGGGHYEFKCLELAKPLNFIA